MTASQEIANTKACRIANLAIRTKNSARYYKLMAWANALWDEAGL